MPLTGIWKLSVTQALRHGAPSAAAKLVPRRVRLLQDAGVEVPYEDGSTGRWELQDALPGEANQTASLSIERADASSLDLRGLYDGERIAGTIKVRHPPANAEELVGEFLCTRLFTFWGTPQPAAAAAVDPKEDS